MVSEIFNLGITNVHARLSEAHVDPTANIRIARLGYATINGDTVEYSVAEIRDQVAPHVHMRGDESYLVLEGTGDMFIGKVEKHAETPAWGIPSKVSSGDAFTIPAKHAHCLKRTGSEPLLILFFGAPSNLAEDRTIVSEPNASDRQT